MLSKYKQMIKLKENMKKYLHKIHFKFYHFASTSLITNFYILLSYLKIGGKLMCDSGHPYIPV